jgi:hypothetical protein
MPSDPQVYNVFRTDEVMRRAAVKAAEYGIKVIDEASVGTTQVLDKLRDLGVFIRGCGEAMHWPEPDSNGPDFDE